jgi:hypothetical protein
MKFAFAFIAIAIAVGLLSKIENVDAALVSLKKIILFY